MATDTKAPAAKTADSKPATKAEKGKQLAEGTSKNKIKITACTCKHEYQDTKYGKQMRVHNPFKKGDSFGHRCTVCATER